MTKPNIDKEKKIYLRGYRDGFMSALTMAWAFAEDLLISVDNNSKDLVRDFIKKLNG